MFSRVTVAVTISLMIVLAGVYVISTFLYLTPPNPVKAQLLPLLVRVVFPLFTQNWHLFAPNPIRTNYVLTGRCRIGPTVTPWHDLTQPLLGRLHQTRSTPLGRVLRIQQNAIRLTLGMDQDEWRPLICRREPSAAVCRRDSPAHRRSREAGLTVLRHAVTSFCDRAYGSRQTDALQVRILIHTPPPWSRREASAEHGTTRFVSLPWTPPARVR